MDGEACGGDDDGDNDDGGFRVFRFHDIILSAECGLSSQCSMP